MILFLIKILLSFLRLFVVAIERVDRDITGGSVAGSSVFDPVKKIIGVRSGEEEDASRRRKESTRRGSVYDGTDRTRDRSTGSSRDGLLQTARDREEVRSTTGPIGRGTEALVLRDVLLQTAGGSSGVLLQTAGGSRDLSTVKDR